MSEHAPEPGQHVDVPSSDVEVTAADADGEQETPATSDPDAYEDDSVGDGGLAGLGGADRQAGGAG